MADDQEAWQVQGAAPELYERILVPAVTRPWANDLLDRVDVRLGDRVLDVACGTGIVARVAAERLKAGRVVGLDVNPGMVGVARSLPKTVGLPIEWIEASALSLPFADQGFEVVVCQLGLQFFPDPARALDEMRRVLVPGGRVGVSVFAAIDQNPATLALSDALDAHIGDGASRAKRNEHSLGDPGELDALFRAAGFLPSVETVTRTVTFPSVEGYVDVQLSATPLASLLGTRSADDRRRIAGLIRADVGSRLAPFTVAGDLRFPQCVHVVLAFA